MCPVDIKQSIFISLIVMLILSACKKEITPLEAGVINSPSAALNFYSASDLQYNLGSNRYVFIDRAVDTASLNPAVPYFSNINPIDLQEYPISNLTYDAYNFISYVRITAGNHHIVFTDGNRETIKDTVLNLADTSYTSLYLTDAGHNGEPASYRLLASPEEHKGVPGRVRMRVVNLSPDVGSISCYLQNANGTILFSPLPQQLAFGTASPYLELDTAGAYRGKLNLQIIADKDPLHSFLFTQITANPGHSYVVIIKGFYQPTTRLVPTGKNPDGSIKYQAVAISPNLRVNIRQSY